MTTPEGLTAVEELIERNNAAVADLRRLYGFSESEAVYFMRLVDEAGDSAVDSVHVEQAA